MLSFAFNPEIVKVPPSVTLIAVFAVPKAGVSGAVYVAIIVFVDFV